METTTSSGQDIRISRRDREDRDQRNERFRLSSRERDDRPQTQTLNRNSRPRQRSPIDYDDMDRIPQGGATSSFNERRNIPLRNNVPDIVPSPEIGFSLMSETRTKYDDRFIPTRDVRFRQPGSSPTIPTAAHREYFSPGPGSQYGFREFFRYPDEREWVSGRSPYSRERERDRERERERDRERRDRDRAYRTSNISHFERDNQHDPYDYRDRDYHRKRYPRDWDYRRAGVSSGPGYRDDPHDSRYETSLSRGESGDSERNGRYFMATRHNHWRQRDRRSTSPSTRSSITNSPPPPSHHRSRSTKTSTRSASPQTRSSTGNSEGSSPKRSDLERVISSKRPLKISIQKRVGNNSENEDEINQYKEQVEESMLHNSTEPLDVYKNMHTSGKSIHDEANLEERSLKESEKVHNNADDKNEGYESNEKGGWTGWRSIVATNEEKDRDHKKLKDDAADSDTATDQTADMDLSSGENDEQPSQSQNKFSICSDDLESMEESDAVDDSIEFHVETSKKDNASNNHIYEESPSHEMNEDLNNHQDNLSSKSKIGELTNHENNNLPVTSEVTNIPTSSSQYIIESTFRLEDDKIDYNAIGAEIEKVENEIDHYKSLLDQKRRRIEEKSLARANRKSKSNKRVNFEFHQEAILIEVEQMESTLTNEQTINNELTVNHVNHVNHVQNSETVFTEYIFPENDKVTNDHEDNIKSSNMWEIIYSENKEKTEDIPFDSFIRFGSWGQTNEIYKNLSEYPFFQQNILDYNRLRQMLMEDFQDQKSNIKQKELALQQEWKTVHYAWKQKFESLQKTKGKMKQDDNDGNSSTSGFAARWPVRTNRGRRRGDVVRSEAEMEEVMKILQDEQRKCQTWANVPPMILDPKERQQAKFINNNRCVSDPECFYDFNVDINTDWTIQEREDFYELFKSFPKKFGKIAEHLKIKSANDCVMYYYRNKKELNLKDLIPKNGRGQRMIALNSKAKKNNHVSPNNSQNIVPINFSDSGMINNSKVLENIDEGSTRIDEISEANEISNKAIERLHYDSVPPLIEQQELHKHSDFNEEIPSGTPDLLMKHHNNNNKNILSNESKLQEQFVNNSEPSISIQETVEEIVLLPATKKTRASKPRRKQKVIKDSDQQEEGEIVKKKRNLLHGPPSVNNDDDDNMPVIFDSQTSRKQNSINDDDSVEEAARGLTLMSLEGNANDNTHSSTQQESVSVSKSKGRPKQIETLVEKDNEISSNKSSITNDDRITSQKKISSYWNKREVSQFEQSLNEFGKDFRKISEKIGSKTEVQVKNYYEKHFEKQNIGSNNDDVETRPFNTSDDIQSSKEKQSQTKSNVQTSRGNVSLENLKHNTQGQHNIPINSQNDKTVLSINGGFFPENNIINVTTERQSQITELSGSLNKSSNTSPSSETVQKSSSILNLLNPSNINMTDVNDHSWFSEEQSEMRSNRNEVVVGSERVNDRKHSTTGTISSDANVQDVISSVSRHHFMTQNPELHLSARPNNHPTLQFAPYLNLNQMNQQIAAREMAQKQIEQQQRQQQQHYAHMLSNPQNQQARYRPPGYIYMQSNQQVHQQAQHQQVQQQLTHQNQIQHRIHNSVQVPSHNITSNTTQTFVNNNFSVPRVYSSYSSQYLLGLPSNNNTLVGQQLVNTGHHTTSSSQHNNSQQSSFPTHQSSDYNSNEMTVGQIHRPFNGASRPSHLFTRTPQSQIRPQVHYQQALHRVPGMNSNIIGHPTSSISGASAVGELNYNHNHILQTRPSIVIPGTVQGVQSVVGHGHAHNFTNSPRPFSGDQQQSSSERSNSRLSSPILCPKIEPPS
ncbi:hypothetical protein RclHR1_00320012 [Rhizophagus clarus]|uniref:Serine/arginine repetitive matrix protein 2-like isoform X4 n=1 Tax=Rhizophagus clarus TaxID=94130 RepID=A0A2Z6R7H7_9GLOM|nr:hypothetical protein RclHR1_00320012 [Rhizophagus clarus]GES93678.1 serine/arginine repetitive matrix protein 2-like isoform X4 [Rhizophagus clarus]